MIRNRPALAVLGVFAGFLASIAIAIYLNTQASGSSLGFVFVCSFSTVPAPSFPDVLTTFSVEPVSMYLLAVSAIGYAILFRKMRAAGHSKRLPIWRAVLFEGGIVLVLVTVFGPLAAYDRTFLTVHMLQHFILITIAPPLLLGGAPLTLLLMAVGRSGRQRFFYPVLHSRVFQAFAHPLIGLSLFILVPTLWYITPALDWMLKSAWVHYGGYAVFLFAGLHYWWPIVPANPTRWHLAYPVRLLYLLALMPIHAFLGLLFYSPNNVLYPQLSAIARTWGPSPLLDQQAAGVFMFVGGEAIGLIALLLVAFQWASHDERMAQRSDRAMERARQRALAGEDGIS
jgi:putative copper resistance protein D